MGTRLIGKQIWKVMKAAEKAAEEAESHQVYAQANSVQVQTDMANGNRAEAIQSLMFCKTHTQMAQHHADVAHQCRKTIEELCRLCERPVGENITLMCDRVKTYSSRAHDALYQARMNDLADAEMAFSPI